MTHICVGKLTSIGSDNGLSPGRRQVIIWTNTGKLLIGPYGTNYSEILGEILTFSFTKMGLKVSSAKWRQFCLGLNVLNLDTGPEDVTYAPFLHDGSVMKELSGHGKAMLVGVTAYTPETSIFILWCACCGINAMFIVILSPSGGKLRYWWPAPPHWEMIDNANPKYNR